MGLTLAALNVLMSADVCRSGWPGEIDRAIPVAGFILRRKNDLWFEVTKKQIFH